MPLQSLTGEELLHAKLFVHVALTNRRGGGKPHKRGLSVRKARKGRDYTALRDLGVRAVDDVFKAAAPLLREATDLREEMQVRRTFLEFVGFEMLCFADFCFCWSIQTMLRCWIGLKSTNFFIFTKLKNIT